MLRKILTKISSSTLIIFSLFILFIIALYFLLFVKYNENPIFFIMSLLSMPFGFIAEILTRAIDHQILNNNIWAISIYSIGIILNLFIILFIFSKKAAPDKKFRLDFSLFFFIFWQSIMFLGADHPLPSGFISIIMTIFILSVVIFFKIPSYFYRIREKNKLRFVITIFEGFTFGVIIAIIFNIINPHGEPSINPTLFDRSILCIVTGLISVINALFLYLCCYFHIKSKKIQKTVSLT